MSQVSSPQLGIVQPRFRPRYGISDELFEVMNAYLDGRSRTSRPAETQSRILTANEVLEDWLDNGGFFSRSRVELVIHQPIHPLQRVLGSS